LAHGQLPAGVELEQHDALGQGHVGTTALELVVVETLKPSENASELADLGDAHLLSL